MKFTFFKNNATANETSDLYALGVPLLDEHNEQRQQIRQQSVSLGHEEVPEIYHDIVPPKNAFQFILNHGNSSNNDDSNSNKDSARDSSPENNKTANEVSRNIPLTIAYTFITQTSRSLWSNNILSSYVYLLENNNAEAVGFITAIMGMTQVFVALPAGHLADTYRRDTVIRIGSVFGAIALAATCFAVYQQDYQSLVGALALWGVFWGTTSTSIMALFADSIQEGQRAKYFTNNLQVTRAAQMIGPILALGLFSLLGDQWTVEACSWAIAIAQVVCVPAVLLLCYLKDDYAVNSVSSKESTMTRRTISTHGSSCSLALSSSDSDVEEEDEELGDRSERRRLTRAKDTESRIDDDNETQSIQCHDYDDEEDVNHSSCCKGVSDRRFVSVAVAVSDTVAAFASGMSIRYFPIFFMKTLDLHPTQVQMLYIIAPMGQIILAHYVQQASKVYGRCQVTVLCRFIGVIFMVAMILSYEHIPSVITPSSVRLTCYLYLVRTIFMNCTQGLTKSILMDSVPRKERGKWSALESFNTASWSGSSFIGGILVGMYGISVNFYVTAAMQFLATLPLMLLFSKVLPEGKGSSSSTDESGEEEGQGI